MQRSTGFFGRMVSIALVAMLVAAACGGSDDEASSGDTGSGATTGDEATTGDDEAGDGQICPVDALEEADGPVEIVVWHSFIALQKRTLESLIEQYNASQDKVVVRAESQGVGPAELHTKIEQAAPDRSLPAVVVPDDTKTRFIADSGLFLPAEACFAADPEAQAIRDDFLPIAEASYTIDGQLWPASFSTLTALIYFNRDHFEAAGLDPDNPPTTIDEMLEAARTIKAANLPGVDRPMVFQANAFLLEWWLSGALQELVNEENGRSGGWASESSFDNPTTREILTKLQEAKAEGILDITPGTDGNANHLLAMAGQQSSFTVDSSGAASTVAGVIEGTIAAEDLSAELGVDLPEGLQLDLNIDVGPYPGVEASGKGQVGGFVWYMTDTVSDEEKAAAWDFVRFNNSVEAQVEWGIEGSSTPVSQAAAADPFLQEAWASTLGGQWQKVAYDVLAGIDTDFPGPVIGPYDEVRVAIEKAMDQVLLDDGSVDAAVVEADATIMAALESYRQDVGA
ncbi:MAG: extracellular solute-binding protein [Acidimicrobiales bacterium]